ncbi:MAG: hypothetical protein K2Y27_23850 [Xanthobacteraceae bacterium]|nr:hypothetical protein [Xanthobacteraceae bacterium]
MGSIKIGWTKVGGFDRSKPDRSKSDRSESDRSKNLNAGLRAHIEQSRKRFQCDVLGFWRQCRRTGCRQGHRCTGDPFDCFRRRYAAMPRDHEDFWRATLLSRTTGIGTAEKTLRAVGLAMPRRIWAEAGNPASPRRPCSAEAKPLRLREGESGLGRAGGPPHRADEAATAVVPVQESDASRLRGQSPPDVAEARLRGRSPIEMEDARRTRWEAEILAKLSPESIADLEKRLGALGMTLQREIPPEHEGLSPSREAVAAAPAVVPADIARPQADPPELGMDVADAADTIEWSPMTGSSVDPVRAAALPLPGDAPSARAGPASPGPADAVPAGPPQSGPPPGIEPWQAWCDDEGRLHMPDPAAVNERFRMLTCDEIQQRLRAYGA